jgi:hypothetical protein
LSEWFFGGHCVKIPDISRHFHSFVQIPDIIRRLEMTFENSRQFQTAWAWEPKSQTIRILVSAAVGATLYQAAHCIIIIENITSQESHIYVKLCQENCWKCVQPDRFFSSMTARHFRHFFILMQQSSQTKQWLQGRKITEAFMV